MKRSLLILCALVTLAPAELPKATVSITSDGTRRMIKSNGLPDHEPGQFPRRGNPNSISAQDYSLTIPVKPEPAASPTPSGRAFFGIALNGVPFEPGTAEFWDFDQNSGWKYEALSGKIDLGLDDHMAHVQPNGAYHYHGLPSGLISRLGGDATKMLLIGYAADGFPIYTNRAHAEAKDPKSPLKTMRPSYQVRPGIRPSGPGGAYNGTFTEDYEFVAGSGDLDECNGRFGVTPDYPSGTYYYCVTSEFPQLSRLWRGPADPSFQKKGPRGGIPGGQRRGGPGRQNGVSDRVEDAFLPQIPF